MPAPLVVVARLRRYRAQHDVAQMCLDKLVAQPDRWVAAVTRAAATDTPRGDLVALVCRPGRQYPFAHTVA